MAPLARHLRRSRPALAVDLPGFGRSQGPPHALDVEGLAAALGAWMRAAGVPRAHLVGVSFGCQVVAELLLREPALGDRAVLVGPTMAPDLRGFGPLARRRFGRGGGEPPGLALLTVRDYVRAGLPRVLETYRHAFEDRIEDKLPSIRSRCLVVRGGNDVVADAAWAARVAALLPRSRLTTIDGHPHSVHLTATAELAHVIEDFLDEP